MTGELEYRIRYPVHCSWLLVIRRCRAYIFRFEFRVNENENENDKSKHIFSIEDMRLDS